MCFGMVLDLDICLHRGTMHDPWFKSSCSIAAMSEGMLSSPFYPFYGRNHGITQGSRRVGKTEEIEHTSIEMYWVLQHDFVGNLTWRI